MDNELTDVTVLLDRSGSMVSIASDIVGGLKRLIQEQKAAPGRCTFTLVQFDSMDPQQVVVAAQPIKDVREAIEFIPRACTPLLDAMGRAIVTTGERLAAMPEADRPGKVVFVVITDGLENASVEYTKPRIKEMVTRQTDAYKWQFIFLAANMDAIAEGDAIGTRSATSVNWQATAGSVRGMLSTASGKLSAYRSTGDASQLAYSAQDRADTLAK